MADDAEPTGPVPFPAEIVGLRRDTVTIAWDDGHESRFPARALRLACRCASCVDEWTGERRIDESKVPWPLHCLDIEMAGNYGIKFRWSDGHDTGIYRLRELRRMCPCPSCAAARGPG